METQVFRTVEEMQAGEVRFVDPDHIVVDYERHMWIVSGAPTWSQADMVDQLEGYAMDEEESPDYVRIIMVDEGIIADYSHADLRDWNTLYAPFERDPTGVIVAGPEACQPVIHAVFNREELGVIVPALAGNDIDIEATNIDALAEAAQAQLDAQTEELEEEGRGGGNSQNTDCLSSGGLPEEA